jgi:UPF0755 protein
VRRSLKAALALFVFFCILAGGFVFTADWYYDKPGPLPQAEAVVVPHGGLQDVAASLLAAHVIDNARAFELAVLLTSDEGPLHAAELPFPAAGSLRAVLATLRTARPVQHHLTIPEGLTAKQISQLVAHAEALQGDAPLPAEGATLPETYSYEYDTSRTALVERMMAAMQRTLSHEWQTRDPSVPLASPFQALVLASIVERETAKPEERPRVAAVYLNRLRLGMKLQSDPTVVYEASSGAGVLDHGLTRAELDHDDPYNTYRTVGLPPGPICAPGLAAIHAVLQPAHTDELYFVADGTGGHAFSRTPEEHARNVLKWRAIENARSAAPAAPDGP